MTKIQYRPYQPQDADAVKAIINQAFTIDRFVKEPRLLDGALEVYLRDCLLKSTYAQVAVRDGRAVGILMGRVTGRERLPGRLGNRLRHAWNMAKTAVLGITEYKSLIQIFAFDTVYANLRNIATAPTTDELTLFAVDASTRGHGVGKHLFDAYMGHLREHGREDFYLYTDTRCTYGFYEKQGMTRAAEQDMTIRLDGKPETLGVFLYAGQSATTTVGTAAA